MASREALALRAIARAQELIDSAPLAARQQLETIDLHRVRLTPQAKSDVERLRGVALGIECRHDEAVSALRAALVHLDASGCNDPGRRAACLLALGSVHEQMSQLKSASGAYTELLATAGAPPGASQTALLRLTCMSEATADLGLMLQWCNVAENLHARKRSPQLLLAMAYGAVYSDLPGKLPSDLAEVDSLETGPSPSYRIEAQALIAWRTARSGDGSTALQLADDAVVQAKKAHLLECWIRCKSLHGCCLALSGALEQALKVGDAVLPALGDLGEVGIRLFTYRWMQEAASGLQDWRRASALSEERAQLLCQRLLDRTFFALRGALWNGVDRLQEGGRPHEPNAEVPKVDHKVAAADGSGGLDAPVILLSGHEHELVELIAEGLSNTEIAGKLKLSRYTVRNRLHQLMSRLGVANRAALVSEVWMRSPRARL